MLWQVDQGTGIGHVVLCTADHHDPTVLLDLIHPDEGDEVVEMDFAVLATDPKGADAVMMQDRAIEARRRAGDDK